MRPSHPGNVGAVARAMRTMGLRRLVIVDPKLPGVCSNPQAIARASGALDVLRNAQVVESLAQALASCTRAVAVSADPREFGPQPQAPEAVSALVRAELEANGSDSVAFVFGTERTGLSIEEALACQTMLSIPGADDYHSLNLSQAVQIVAYCLRASARAEACAPSAPADPFADAATLDAVEGLFEHLERALIAIDFLDPAHPKKLMPRLRRLFSRTRLEREEVDLLRGICTQAIRTARFAQAASERPPNA